MVREATSFAAAISSPAAGNSTSTFWPSFKGCRLIEGDLHLEYPGIDGTTGVLGPETAADNDIGDFLHRAAPACRVTFDSDYGVGTPRDQGGIELVDFGLDAQPAQVGNRQNPVTDANHLTRDWRWAAW